MSNEPGLVKAYILDGLGGGRTVGWPEIESFAKGSGFLWVHLDYSSPQSRRWLKKSGLNQIEYLGMMAEENRPRTVVSTNGLLIFLRGVNLNPGQDPEDMISMRIFLNHDIIITSRRRKLVFIDDVIQDIESGNGPKTTMELFLLINHYLTERIERVINDLEERAEDLEEQVISNDHTISRETIADLRREVITLRRYLAPQRAALHSLETCDSEIVSYVDRINLREEADRIVRYLEDLDAAKETATVTFEELNNQISEHMNKRMYIMSQVAVIFLPITFITGLLGINVGGIPGAKSKWAFLIVTALSIGIGLLLLWIFRKKKMM